MNSTRRSIIWVITASLLWLLACSPGTIKATHPVLSTEQDIQALTPTDELIPPPTPLPNPVQTLAVPPVSSASPSPDPSQTPTLIPSPTITPEPLPTFYTDDLRPNVLPQSYLLNACQVLKQRWDPQGSPPGTVVVPVMYHSIAHDGRTISDPKDISATEFADFVQHAQFLGFETITTAQLWDFLSNNALIPPRSMILIVDDRRPGVITEHFLPILEANDWTVTAAYISDPNSFEWAWDEMLALYATGRLDVQSHGYTGTVYINAQTTEAEIRQEIVDSVSVLEERFGQRPLAFVWPGGNFNSLAVQIAREAGYQLGFTAYSRGPLLFNWIPQGEPERLVGDPLLTLPRAWSNSASFNLDQAIQIGDQARLYAEQNYPFEAAWYARWCSGSLPEP